MRRSMILAIGAGVLAMGCVCGVARSENYAVLFSGGAGADNNHDRYYNQTLEMYNILVDDLHWRPDCVTVVFADGTDPAVDRSSGVNSDWSSVTARGSTVMLASEANLETAITDFDIRESDMFYLWTFDHGNGAENEPGTTGEETLSGWTDNIEDEDLPAWCDPLPATRKAYVFGQCYAGGMLDNFGIGMGQGEFGCAATNHYEQSYGDQFVGAWNDAIRNEGKTKTHDIYQWAYTHDSCATDGEGPGGTYASGVEHPWKVGDNLDVAVAAFQGLGAGGSYRYWATTSNWDWQPDIERTVRVRFTSTGGELICNAPSAKAGYLVADWAWGVGSGSEIRITSPGDLTSHYQVIGDREFGRVVHEGGTNTLSRTLTLGQRSGASGTYMITGGSLSANRVSVGYEGTGQLSVANATVTPGSMLLFGEQAGGIGYLYLYGGGVINSNYARVGYFGTGLAYQYGGSHTVSGSMYIGMYGGSYGLYYLGDGTLTADIIAAGYGDYGKLWYQGGTLTVNDYLAVYSDGIVQLDESWTTGAELRMYGGQLDANASLTFSGSVGDPAGGFISGGTLSAEDIYVGSTGPAEMWQDDGTVDANDMFVVANSTAAAEYDLQDGTVQADRVRVGYYGPGTMHQSGGSVTATSVRIGYGGTGVGVYNLSSGTVQASWMDLGQFGTGTLNYSGGTINVDTIRMHTHGTFNVDRNWTTGAWLDVSGGTLDAGGYSLRVEGPADSPGTLHVSSGLVNATNLYIGDHDTGQALQTDGTVEVSNYLILGDEPGSSGSYDLQAGRLECVHGRIGYHGSGTLTQSGGTFSSMNNLYVGVGSGTGVYQLSGGRCEGPSLHVGSGWSGQVDYSGGTIDTDLVKIYDNGTMNVTTSWEYDGTLHVSGGTLAMAGQRLDLQSPGGSSSQMSGGSMTTMHLAIGWDQTGAFSQSGGIQTVTGDLVLGTQSTGVGTYDMHGGTLDVGRLFVGYSGDARFTIHDPGCDVTIRGDWLFYPGGVYEAPSGATVVLTDGADMTMNGSVDPIDVEDLVNTILVCRGESGNNCLLEAAGQDLGPVRGAGRGNFGLDTLVVQTGDGMVEIVDHIENGYAQEAIYVETLVIECHAALTRTAAAALYYTNGGSVKEFFPGDMDLDGIVGAGDLGGLARNFGGSGCWDMGDFNGDGSIAAADLGILARWFGASTRAGNSVPVPSTLLLLSAGAIACLRGRRSARRGA